jgi:hypothetical protein
MSIDLAWKVVREIAEKLDAAPHEGLVIGQASPLAKLAREAAAIKRPGDGDEFEPFGKDDRLAVIQTAWYPSECHDHWKWVCRMHASFMQAQEQAQRWQKAAEAYRELVFDIGEIPYWTQSTGDLAIQAYREAEKAGEGNK